MLLIHQFIFLISNSCSSVLSLFQSVKMQDFCLFKFLDVYGCFWFYVKITLPPILQSTLVHCPSLCGLNCSYGYFPQVSQETEKQMGFKKKTKQCIWPDLEQHSWFGNNAILSVITLTPLLLPSMIFLLSFQYHQFKSSFIVFSQRLFSIVLWVRNTYFIFNVHCKNYLIA